MDLSGAEIFNLVLSDLTSDRRILIGYSKDSCRFRKVGLNLFPPTYPEYIVRTITKLSTVYCTYRFSGSGSSPCRACSSGSAGSAESLRAKNGNSKIPAHSLGFGIGWPAHTLLNFCISPRLISRTLLNGTCLISVVLSIFSLQLGKPGSQAKKKSR